MGKKLTIGLVTMNRERQVAEAIQSCLNSHLPNETKFMVIDNASTDNTETVVKAILNSSGYPYVYHKNVSNIGAGEHSYGFLYFPHGINGGVINSGAHIGKKLQFCGK